MVFAVVQTAVLDHHRRTLASIDLGVATLSALAEQSRTSVDVQVYEDDQVYEATRRAVENARERVWVSCLRSPYGAAARHIQACRDWALASPRHRFRRVILQSDVVDRCFRFYFESLWGSRAAKDIEKCAPDRPPLAAGAEPLAEH